MSCNCMESVYSCFVCQHVGIAVVCIQLYESCLEETVL
ncbi:hypothetical protein CP8484711_2791 [Chlamydia psittaci 84-8471/1]|nr:hypothetical protein CP8484711_2791 [Chlamydia psittaci 84-8471/1]